MYGAVYEIMVFRSSCKSTFPSRSLLNASPSQTFMESNKSDRLRITVSDKQLLTISACSCSPRSARPNSSFLKGIWQ